MEQAQQRGDYDATKAAIQEPVLAADVGGYPMNELTTAGTAIGGVGVGSFLMWVFPKLFTWIGQRADSALAEVKAERDQVIASAKADRDLFLEESQKNRDLFEKSLTYQVSEAKQRADRAELKVDECERKHEAVQQKIAELSEKNGQLQVKVEMLDARQTPEMVAKQIAQELLNLQKSAQKKATRTIPKPTASKR